MSDPCPHGKTADEACPQCSKTFKDVLLAGRADAISVNILDFASDVQAVYDRLAKALDDPRRDEPGFGTVQCMAVGVLALVVLESLVKQSPSLRAEWQLQDLIFTSLKLKLMPPAVGGEEHGGYAG